MSADWKAGDKALCVDDSPGAATGLKSLVNGTVYLVSDVWIATNPAGALLLSVCGITLPYTRDGMPRGFRHSRFRKVIPACDRNTQEQEASL